MKKLFVVLALSVLLIGQNSHGLVRVMPREDYGSIHPFRPFKHPADWFHLANPILDRMNSTNDLMKNGQQMGGDYDLVYQEDENHQTHVYSCPTIKPCLEGKEPGNNDISENATLGILIQPMKNPGKDKVTADTSSPQAHKMNACVQNNLYWQCDELVAAPKDVMCHDFVETYRKLVTKSWVVTEVVGTAVFWPIKWLKEGIQAIADDVAGGIQTALTAKDIFTANCNSSSLGLATSDYSTLGKNLVFIVQEQKKEQVSWALASLSKKAYNYSTTDDEKMEFGGYRRWVSLDINSIKSDGYVPAQIMGKLHEN